MLNIQTINEETRNLSILFVEDDTALRMRTVEVLEDYFHRVDSAVDGLDALVKFKDYHAVRKSHYDLVISDIQMPNMDGVELTEKLYAIRENQPIIILSAHTEPEHLLALINFGVAQFITKPIQNQKMLDTLYKVCKKINSSSITTHEQSSIIALSENTFWERDKKKLTSAGADVALTKYEINLMVILTNKFEQVCSADEILNHFFLNNIDVSPENLRGLMMRLRRKLPEKTLTSVYGLGYRLCPIR